MQYAGFGGGDGGGWVGGWGRGEGGGRGQTHGAATGGMGASGTPRARARHGVAHHMQCTHSCLLLLLLVLLVWHGCRWCGGREGEGATASAAGAAGSACGVAARPCARSGVGAVSWLAGCWVGDGGMGLEESLRGGGGEGAVGRQGGVVPAAAVVFVLCACACGGAPCAHLAHACMHAAAVPWVDLCVRHGWTVWSSWPSYRMLSWRARALAAGSAGRVYGPGGSLCARLLRLGLYCGLFGRI